MSLGVPVFRGLWTVYVDDFGHNFLNKCVMEDAKQGICTIFSGSDSKENSESLLKWSYVNTN